MIKGYIRYCDDFVLFGEKEELRAAGEKIRRFVEEGLLLNFSRFDLFPTSRGIDFLGYRHFPGGYILVRKRTAKRMKKTVREIPYMLRNGKTTKGKALSTVASIRGWLIHANSHNLQMAIELNETKEAIENGKIFRIRGSRRL